MLHPVLTPGVAHELERVEAGFAIHLAFFVHDGLDIEDTSSRNPSRRKV